MEQHELKLISIEQDKTSRTTTKLSLDNDGADDKFQIKLRATDLQGQYRTYLVIEELKMGKSVTIDITSSKLSIAEFSISWQDACARIHRPTPKSSAGTAQGFKTISCSWVTVDGTQEEIFVSGQS